VGKKLSASWRAAMRKRKQSAVVQKHTNELVASSPFMRQGQLAILWHHVRLRPRKERGWNLQFVMNIVIQQIETREFLAGSPNEWVKDPHDALVFSDTRHALAYCRRHELEGVRLVVFFKNNKVSLLLYVPGSAAPAPAGVAGGRKPEVAVS
jgi:hypothetical protein